MKFFSCDLPRRFAGLRMLLTTAALICLALGQPAAQAKPVNILWRLDHRAPDQIFLNKQGFDSWGTNDNVMDHISGNSCVEVAQSQRDSAFVSLSADYLWARQYAVARAFLTPGTPTYLYQIRADAGFYSAETSLRRYAQTHPTEEISDLTYLPAQMAQEYFAHLHIPVENIVQAEAFRVSDGTMDVPQIILNPHYVAAVTSASVEAYGVASGQPTGAMPIRRGLLTWARNFPRHAGACISDMGRATASAISQADAAVRPDLSTTAAPNCERLQESLPYALERLAAEIAFD